MGLEAALIALAVAALADVVTTVRALKRPGTREANPVIRFFMRHLGRGWVVAKLAITALGAWLLHPVPEAIWALAALTAFVAYRNSRF